MQWGQIRTFDFVGARELIDQEITIRLNLKSACAKRSSRSYPFQERTVFGDIVRPVYNKLADLLLHAALGVFEDDSDPRWTGVPPRCSVDLHNDVLS
jgi:hypothetical protein